MKYRVRVLGFVVVALALAGLTGCHGGGSPGGHSVELLVLKSRDGSTLALVPVWINGKGPFAFALDTGASHSLIDRDLAAELGLEETGPAVEMTGVASVTRAREVQVGDWRVGDVRLPARTLVTLELPEANKEVHLRGLLGSDMLSRFGAVTVDYSAQRLVFRSTP